MREKTPKESMAIMTNLVLPSEINMRSNMFGGELLSRMDRICSIAARRHAESFQVITASVNHVSFNHIIPVGSIVKLQAKVSRAFNTSMEVYVDVWIEDPHKQMVTKTNSGIYTFVALDEDNNLVKVPPLKPESEQEKIRYEDALKRKQLSLILAGKLNPKDADELRAIFD